MKKFSLQELILKADMIHNHKYDYSKVSSCKKKNKVIIICRIHGDFLQSWSDHLLGHGCATCSKNKKMNSIEFIKKANIIHNNKYDYDLVLYEKSHKMVSIICKIHGVFFQSPTNHLSGQGCAACAKVKPLDTNIFIKKSKNIYSTKYSYEKTSYINSSIKLTIKCKLHGYFDKYPLDFLKGSGCQHCSNKAKLDNLTFISKSNIIHDNKYNYDLVSIINNHSKVKILCSKHGIFEQSPSAHLRGSECPKCRGNSISKIEKEWLTSLNIDEINRNKTITINNKKYRVDAFVPETNTIYEFYGDFWHGNPKVYKNEEINKRSKKSFGELYRLTMMREDIYREAKFNVISIWELDYKNRTM